MTETMQVEQEIISAVTISAGLILQFKKAIEETKKKYSDKPRYLALSIAQTQRQIQKMIDGIQSLLGVRAGDALPLSMRLRGAENPDGLLRIDSLKSFLEFLGAAVKEASLEIDPSVSPGDYLIRAANIGSLCLSIEPDAKTGSKGGKVLSRLGLAIQEVFSLKSEKPKDGEISSLAKKIFRLLPRKKLHIDMAEFHGTSMPEGSVSFEKGEIKIRRSRVKSEGNPEFSISGRIVAIDGEKKVASLAGDPRIKFRYVESQVPEVMKRFMTGNVDVVLVDQGDKKHLVRFNDPRIE